MLSHVSVFVSLMYGRVNVIVNMYVHIIFFILCYCYGNVCIVMLLFILIVIY